MPHRLPLWATLPHLITLGVLCGTLLAIWPATLGRALVTLLLAGIIRLLAGPMVAWLVRPRIRSVVRPADAIRRVVTLIHGTYAPHARWTQAASPLVSHLIRELAVASHLDLGTDLDSSKEQKSDTAVYALDWSGENSLLARARAASTLEAHVYEVAQRWAADVPHFIIAHSHGGNVALNALRHSYAASLVRGVACLSTPFLYVRTRRIGSRAAKVLRLMVMIYLLGIGGYGAWVAARKIEPLWGETKAFTVFVALFVLFFITIQLFSIFVEDDVLRHLTNWARRIERACAIPTSPAPRLLIIRSSADEASSLLSVWQFLSWVTSGVWTTVANVVDWVPELIDRAITLASMSQLATQSRFAKWSKFFSWLPTVWGWALVGVLALAGLHLYGGPPLVKKVFDTFFSYVWTMLFVPIIVVASVAPLFVIAWSALLLPFGPEFVLAGPLLEISVEATPPGSWRVDHLPPAEVTNLPDPRNPEKVIPGLLHSSAYDDPRAHNLLADWLRDRPEASR